MKLMTQFKLNLEEHCVI